MVCDNYSVYYFILLANDLFRKLLTKQRIESGNTLFRQGYRQHLISLRLYIHEDKAQAGLLGGRWANCDLLKVVMRGPPLEEPIFKKKS